MKKLTLTGGKIYSGEASGQFSEAMLFDFASLDTKLDEPKKLRETRGPFPTGRPPISRPQHLQP
ncbi:MAG: hypothetical protein V4675_13100 [Verrucomicrobiota bacterium]